MIGRHRFPPVSQVLRFAGAQAVLAGGALLLLPVIAKHCGAGQWVAIATGQSVGTVLALVVGFGWTLNGSSLMAARERSPERLLADSLAGRGMVALVGAPIAAVASALIAPQAALLAAAVGAAVTLNGLSPAWYAVGRRRPAILLVFDILPLTVALIISAVAISVGGSLLMYPGAVALARVGATLALALRHRARDQARVEPSWRRQALPAASEFVGGAYSSASPALVAVAAPVPDAAAYASGWRLFVFALVAVVVVGQATQGWVFESHQVRQQRLRDSLVALALVGVVGGATLAVVLPAATKVLFGPALAVSGPAAIGFGASFVAVSISTALARMHLMAAGDQRGVLIGTVVGTLVGIPTTLLGAAMAGETGGALALAASEWSVTLTQLAIVRRSESFAFR